ncbi:MAG: glycosyltransferase [Tolypothrix brevis GSE-NOS-MK-07-07A]|jgi:glycosyltransferase involved in cell wall biosynthesis|nr:glycosyltransferase [Tolypothrix brevis GSE-NOS-MK-07-07A]
MPKVSVIIPSYNHEKFVAEAIQSVLNQTYQDFEIVITDDGSADNTVNIIKQFTDPRIRLFCFAKNRGAAVAANNCLKESKGEYIAMLSSDDVFVPDKLAKQVSFLEEHPEVSAVFSYAQIIDENGNDFAQENHFYKQIFIQPNRNRFEWLNHFFYKGNCLCHPSALIKKKCYEDVGKYDERFAQLPDFDFWIRLCMKYEIYIMPEELIKFRIRDNEANASGNRPEARIRHQLEYKQILNNYFSSEIRNDFYKIFPEAGLDINNNQDDEESIYLQVALLAIKVDLPEHQSFGIDKLYELLDSRKETNAKIMRKYAFDFANLIQITGQYDVYGIISKENLHLQVGQTQVELERSHSQLQETQTELERSHSQLQETQVELERSHSQLQQTQVELERSHSQLQQTQVELERSHSQLQETQRKLDFLKITIRIRFLNNPLIKIITKSSKFHEISPSRYLQGNLETPSTQENNINDTLLVSGWVFSREAKIKSLILVKDNLLENQIEYGFSRPDVSQTYPDVENADSSGFVHNLILNNQKSGYMDIQIWAIFETGQPICCFARRVNFQTSNRGNYIKSPKSQINLLFFMRSVVIKAMTAYKQGRLPLSPALWIYYLRRYYRQIQHFQNTDIKYSGIIHPWQTQDLYQRWLQTNVLSSNLLGKMGEDAEKLTSKGVKISVVVPVYNTPKHFLKEMIDSVRSQIYPNWELCIADDASTKPHVKELLQQVIAEDSRIKIVFRQENGHIVEATNSALEIATGDYVALLDHDDILSIDALLHVAECINNHPEVDWIYTDEDKINESGYHFDPQMKGAWSPEMAITHNFTHHLTVIRKTLIDQLGGMRKGFEGAQDLDLFLRVSEKTTPDKVHHIPYICYHWRTHPGSTASHGTQKQYVFDSAYNAIEDAIQRRGLKAKTFLPSIAKQYGLCLHQIKWDNSLIAENPVTIVIPTKDRVDLLKKCVSSLEKTVDPRFVKLLIIDDCSTENSTHQYFKKLQQDCVLQCRVIRSERKIDVFNYAKLMNLGCEHVDTPYMLHLNNDIQALEPGWLEDMVGWMSIDGVGVVGAKLLYPDQTIQHAGVVVGYHNGLADHLFHRLHKDEIGYICLPHAARNASGVTGACMLTSTNLYRELGGFDEDNFAVEYNDVDYCLRVLRSGKRIVYTPQAILIHETSASRGKSYNPKEHINFIEKYQDFIDPFFSKNLDINSMLMAINPSHYSYVDRISTAKILFITHNLNLEGAPLIVYNYARYFATKGGCEICVISSMDGVLRQEYENLNIQVRIFQETLPLQQESLEKYRQRLQEFGDDLNLNSYNLVVCNTLLSFWGIELAKLFNLPTIWHIHESQSLDMSINNFFGHASKEIMQKILPDCFVNATRVIYQAEATRRIFHQFDIKGNFRTIPGGIDLQKIEDFRNTHKKYQLRDKYGINQEHLVISIIGTTCQRKGQHIFIEAIKELEKLCNDKFGNISCLIVGARNTTYIDSNYLELLKGQIKDLSLNNVSIYFETKDVYDFYALSDIFVCASFEESFPRVLLEAMAFELKIISTDVFGIPEIINDRGEGYLVQPGDAKALAGAIHKCIVEPDISDRLAKNAYAKMYRLFDNNNLLQQHWLLAKEVILSQS